MLPFQGRERQPFISDWLIHGWVSLFIQSVNTYGAHVLTPGTWSGNGVQRVHSKVSVFSHHWPYVGGRLGVNPENHGAPVCYVPRVEQMKAAFMSSQAERCMIRPPVFETKKWNENGPPIAQGTPLHREPLLLGGDLLHTCEIREIREVSAYFLAST